MTATVYDCGEWRSLWAAVNSGDRVAVYAATDWLLEHDVEPAVAAGDERLRAACEYRHHTTPVVVPLGIAALEWVGKLPQESGY